ncbi:mucin-5AC isoform X2 [Drosophila guanche]|uniref:mucin-5AC isoform X2 n=1 Tax=Drosophila guanche TaxID=7266 RepID=UPI001470FAF2|nr:mucin-5AC isoform X2 [Drosophila guanche]
MPQNLCRCGPQVLGAANRAVYCSGPLLDAVQRSNMFPDCKTFVDMKSKYPPERLLADYELFRNCRKNDGSLQFLEMFVEKHFLEKGTELEEWTPPDWKSEPPFANRIADPELRRFGVELNALWKVLGRRMKDEVKENPEKYSIVYVPNPVIVPGGRFIEFYYWDSLWIIRGLLHCGMHATARGMIDNFLSIVRQYGFVPNGGRIYYYGRSQPPMLIHMMKAYVDVTLDEKYAMQSLPLLEAEFDNFVEKHQVQVKGRTMYHYQDYSTGPRPESYREDVASAAEFLSEPEKERHYTQLKSACESGMDFSSRWFIARDGTNRGTLKDIQTTSIVPVDLNVILFRSAKILAEFNRKAGHNSKVEEYSDIACGLVKAVRDVLWNEEAGIWLDYDMLNNRPRPYFSASNFSPLWARAFPLVDTDKISRGVMNYIKMHNLDDYPGGVPNTMNRDTGQQWDYPNVWPPMMFMIIDGLHNLGTPEARAMSERWAHRWVKNNYEAYALTGFMFEKYNCEKFGSGGGGGEYQNQTGFGWTNGIILEYLSRYGPELSLQDRSDVHCRSTVGKSATGNLGDCPVTSQSKMITKKNYIITSENNIAVSNRDGPGHCSGPCAQKVVDEASNRMKQSLVSNIVGHPVVASPKRATTISSGRSTIPATGRSTIHKSGRSTITSYPQLEEASTGEYNASVLPREQASAIPYTREQASGIPYTREQSTSPTFSPGRTPIGSAPESRLPTAVETTVFPERYTRTQSAADPYLREQSAAEAYAREQSAVAPYLRELSAVDAYGREQSAVDPYAREQSAADPYAREQSAADSYLREQSAADPYGREQSAANPYAREQSAVDSYVEEQSTADPYNREQSAVAAYTREQSAVAAYTREQSAVAAYTREQSAVAAYRPEQSVVGREQSALSGAGRTTIPSQRVSSSRKSVENSGSPVRYSREKSAADPYSREQSAISASHRDQSSAIQSPARSPTLTVENNNNNNVTLNQRQSRSPSNPSPVPREQASAVPTQGKPSIDQSSYVEYTPPNDPYSQEQSDADFNSQEQSDGEPFSPEQSAIDNREQSAVDPYTREQSAVDPYSREQSAMDPYTRGQSAADPNGREQSAVDPYSRQQSTAAAYNREKSSADPYKRKQSAADSNNREHSAMDPYSRGQSAYDTYNREKSSADPYGREQSAADPNNREQSAMDPYNREQSAVDPYSREQSAADPYNREQSAMDPYNREQSAVDPYSRQVPAMDDNHREHSSMDPYSQERSRADPYSQEQSVVDSSMQEQATAEPSKSKKPCQRCLEVPTNAGQPQYRIMAAVPFTAAAVPYNASIQPSAAVPYNGEQSVGDPSLVRTTMPGQRETRFTAAPMYAPSAIQQEVLLSPCECSLTSQNSEHDSSNYGQDMQGPATASLAPRGSRSQSGYDPPDTPDCPDLPEGCFVCPRCGGLKQQPPTVQCKATNQPSVPVVPARQVASVEEDCECGPPTSSMQAAPAPVSQTESDCGCSPPTSRTKLPAIKQFPLADQKGPECPQEKPPQRMCCGCPIPSPPQEKDDC